MINVVHDVLTPGELNEMRAALQTAVFVDGSLTAGRFADVKRNQELGAGQELSERLQGIVIRALQRSDMFFHMALPLCIVPPMFNRYEVGMGYGDHSDRAIMRTVRPIRTDVAMTLFLSDPSAYDGGELLIGTDSEVPTSVKLPAGSLVLYPASTLHRVAPVTRGTRVAAFTWMQSMVRSTEHREILLNLFTLSRWAERTVPGTRESALLEGTHANLLRTWADT